MDMIEFMKDKLKYLPDNYLEAMTHHIQDEREEEFDSIYTDNLKSVLDAEWVSNGVSKMVCNFYEYPNIVFKIPFFGDCTIPDDFLDDADAHDSSYADYILDFYDIGANESLFTGASNRNQYCCDPSDYCDAEAHLSHVIPKKIRKMFCTTKHLFDFEKDGIVVPIYIAEKAESEYYSCRLKVSEDSQRIAKKINHAYGFDEDDTCAAFIDEYGKKAVNDLYKFLNYWHISDLHTGNVMFKKNNKLAIIDYSSFNY